MPKGWNQLDDEHSPHNPALTITDERLQTGARDETDLDYCCRCWNYSARGLGNQGAQSMRAFALAP